MSRIENVDTPSLIIDSDVLKRNIDNMMGVAKRSGIDLRPHVKTHKCPELAKMQVRKGAVGIAVAKVSEAEVMAGEGLKNIQIANEVVAPGKMARLVPLVDKCDLTIAVDNRENVNDISKTMKENGTSISVLVDIDVGLHRCGLSHENTKGIMRFVKFLSSKPGIVFKGIMTHAGQVYRCRNIREVEKVGLFEGRRMVELASVIKKAGFGCETVSVGSTPTAMFAGSVPGVTEIRPGNYIFNDMIQVSKGVAKVTDCALRVLSTVISTPSRNRVVIDAGSKGLGPERIPHQKGKGYGHIVNKRATIKRLSEEHGIIGNMKKGTTFGLGERIQIIPNHACYTVNLYDKMFSTDSRVFAIMARGCSQ
ncbi:MAG: alanine racemase [Thermoplasmata archaeon]|nr:alanine racemase [Thermoplasmata archaeon]